MALTTTTAHALVPPRLRGITGRATQGIKQLRPSRKLVVLAVELAGIAAIAYGASLISVAAAWIVGGFGLILEAYALERR